MILTAVPECGDVDQRRGGSRLRRGKRRGSVPPSFEAEARARGGDGSIRPWGIEECGEGRGEVREAGREAGWETGRDGGREVFCWGDMAGKGVGKRSSSSGGMSLPAGLVSLEGQVHEPDTVSPHRGQVSPHSTWLDTLTRLGGRLRLREGIGAGCEPVLSSETPAAVRSPVVLPKMGRGVVTGEVAVGERKVKSKEEILGRDRLPPAWPPDVDGLDPRDKGGKTGEVVARDELVPLAALATLVGGTERLQSCCCSSCNWAWANCALVWSNSAFNSA